MKAEALEKAFEEAERFIELAKKVEIVHDKYANGKPYVHVKDYTKETAACKRASLDLTRALAEMRKP